MPNIRGASVIEGEQADSELLRTLDDKTASTYESTIIECADGRLIILMRNQHPSGHVAYAYSKDGGITWGEVGYHSELPEIFSQPHGISVNTSDGHRCVFANATRLLPFRGEGVLRVSADDGITWPGRLVLKSGHYVYQCLADMGQGRVGILWENEWQGLYFTTVELQGVDMAG